MTEENISETLRLKNLDEIRNYFIDEKNQSGMLSKKKKKFVKFFIILYTYLFLVCTVTGCVFIPALAYLVGIQ